MRPYGASYLEIAEVLVSNGANSRKDLAELWSRIVFNIMVSNTDDHLRNHGFLLTPNAAGLSLNINESDNALGLDLARSVAPFFRVGTADANLIIERLAESVGRWADVATSLGVKRSEQEQLTDAFCTTRRA